MPRRSRKRFYQTNQYIRAPKVRVIDKQGKQIGIMPTLKALSKAREEGLDLVEVAPKANPPVARITDLRSFLNERWKRKTEIKKRSKSGELKEIRLKPFVDEHDLGVKLERMEEFFKNGSKVRVAIHFRGRQLAHREFGEQLLEKVITHFGRKILVESPPKFKGKRLMATLTPKRK